MSLTRHSIAFTFTDREEDDIRALADWIVQDLRKKDVGYRVLVVQRTTELNRIIQGALKRRRQQHDDDALHVHEG